MKTMEKLCRKFERIHPGYLADLCNDNYEPRYTVFITEPVLGLVSRYVFETCRDFSEWINGVVLD